MSTKIFVNLPVKDLGGSIDFFKAIGFAFDPNFTDEAAGCVVIDENIFAMLLTEPFFRSFTNKAIPDASTAEVVTALAVDSRERVDEVVEAALAAGARVIGEPNDQGFMYGRSFHDLDGHIWEFFCLESEGL